MNSPLLSIILPMYNCENYIGMCLDSIMGAGLPSSELEVIVVNDGSVDHSADVVREYMSRYPDIRYFKQENQGISGARNTGFDNCRGEYVYFVDSDDFLYSAPLAKAFDILKENDMDILEIGRVGGTEDELKSHQPSEDVVDVRIVDGCTLFDEKFSFFATSYIVRKSFMLENGIRFQPVYAYEDYCFSVASLLKAHKVVSQKGLQVYAYVTRSESVSHGGGKIRYRKFTDAVIDTRLYVDSQVQATPSLPDDARKLITGYTNLFTLYLVNRALLYYPYDYFKETYTRLQSLRFLPICRNGVKGLKWNTIRFFANCKPLFFSARWMVHLFSN